MLIQTGRIKPELAREMSQWEHNGFSAHKDIDMDTGNEEGITRITKYIARCPIAEAQITQDEPVYDDFAPGDRLLPDG